SAYRGGAFFITPGDLGAPSVTFRGCEATNNVATGNGSESRGGYLFVDGADVRINHEYCKIKNNQSIGGRGGALCLFGDNTRYFYYCEISNNKGGHWGPDPDGITTDDVALNADGTKGDGEYEGGVAFITGGATTFESCALISNQSWSHAGLIRHLNGGDVTFINCTLAKNQSLHNKPVLWPGGQANYTFVNSLFVENLGQNVGNGAGFDFDGSGVRLNIFNSVFTRNVAGGDGAVDLSSGGNYAGVTVKNSMIGLIKGDPAAMTVSDNDAIPTKSNTAMYKVASEESQLDYATLENDGLGCGVNFREGFKFSKSFGIPYYLLETGSTVTKLGDPALLEDYELNTDLFGRVHSIAADGSIPAAPTVAAIDEEYDDTGWEDNIIISSIAFPKSQDVRAKLINTLVDNGIIGVDFGSLRGLAKAELYSVTGQKVETVFDCYVVGKGYYNVQTSTPGIYLLKVSTKNGSFAQRLIIK
ncbi:MAG: T9SS type A sorting domain-containing protein, partial [Candidatus Symbiothrix sp.]|nr:T9SS type A sorting domain-containing protein [Candidatus Symbiothrix sp.]